MKYPLITPLPDEDLLTLYGECAKELKNRGLLAATQKQLKRIISSLKTQEYNTTEVFSRGKIKRTLSHSILIDFLDEDWSYLFSGSSYDKEKKYYVYYHTDPTLPNMRMRKGDKSVEFYGRPFYVGKGTGERYKSKKRGRGHLSIIKNLTTDQGISSDRVFRIFKDGLDEIEALELEAKLITFFGCRSEVSRGKTHFHGIKGGLLVNSDPAARPECVDKMIRIKGGL
jgi:hypothetical protein